jgi:hypothetical protein
MHDLELRLLEHSTVRHGDGDDGEPLCKGRSLDYAAAMQTATRCSPPADERPAAAMSPGAAAMLDHILAGRFIQALQQQPMQALLGAHDQAELSGPAEYYAWAQARLQQQASAATADGGDATAEPMLHTMLLGAVACLHMFVQHNLTG